MPASLKRGGASLPAQSQCPDAAGTLGDRTDTSEDDCDDAPLAEQIERDRDNDVWGSSMNPLRLQVFLALLAIGACTRQAEPAQPPEEPMSVEPLIVVPEAGSIPLIAEGVIVPDALRDQVDRAKRSTRKTRRFDGAEKRLRNDCERLPATPDGPPEPSALCPRWALQACGGGEFIEGTLTHVSPGPPTRFTYTNGGKVIEVDTFVEEDGVWKLDAVTCGENKAMWALCDLGGALHTTDARRVAASWSPWGDADPLKVVLATPADRRREVITWLASIHGVEDCAWLTAWPPPGGPAQTP